MNSTLFMSIQKLKGIYHAEIEIPFANGLYALVGENGCGKSTMLQSLAQLIRPQNALLALKGNDYTNESKVIFKWMNSEIEWFVKNKKWEKRIIDQDIKNNSKKNNNIYGMYEGSLFVGTRFSDSKQVDWLFGHGKIDKDNDLVDADDYVIENLSNILHGDKNHYKSLKRLKNRKLKAKFGLKNLPYFIDCEYGGLISQYRMSSGECLLISLLHFINNSIINQKISENIPILMLLDEIELALHPSAISRFLDLLEEIVQKYSHVSVLLTTHAPEVIRKIAPKNIYKLENNNGSIQIVNPCYPAYAIRELYSHDRYDYLILCEDILTKRSIEYFIDKHKLRESRLVCVCPVGGWKNVLDLHIEIEKNNIVGRNTQIISILDGDVKDQTNKIKQYKNLKKMYLPIMSIEKCLYEKLYKNVDNNFRKILNDKFFTIESIKELVYDFEKNHPNKHNENKELYRHLLESLKVRKIDESSFIEGVLEALIKIVDFSKFEENLKSFLTDK